GGNAFTNSHREQIIAYAARRRLPGMYEYRQWVVAGGLMSYAPDLGALHVRAATYVDQILRGAPAGELPMENPRKYDLVINQRTAEALSLTLPEIILAQATELI